MKKMMFILSLLLCSLGSTHAQTYSSPCIVGTNLSAPFTYSYNSENIMNYPGGILFFRLTITIPMDITVTCQSSYNYALMVSFTDGKGCNSSEPGKYIWNNLSAGTYLLMVDGAGYSGPITTSIQGKLPEPPPPSNSVTASSDRNYILTRTYTSEDKSKYLDAIQYYDGLGRPILNVQRKITPSSYDLAVLQEYDAFGRESNTWLPGTSTGNGAYVAPETVKSSARTLGGDQNPYSRSVYEASPLNRVLEYHGPGASWQNSGHGMKSEFFSNVSGNDTLNCVCYKVPNTSTITDTLVTVSRTGNYASGSLYVTRTQDEDGNASFEFKDMFGQVLLTRQVSYNGSAKVIHDTYYIYDDYGNKIAVLSPLASDAMKGITAASWTNANSAILRDYAYLYMFDSRKRCKAKRLPGCDWVYYVYDTADQLIFTQDGEQRKKSPKEWTFAIPDMFGRVCMTGICKNSYNSLAIASPLAGIVVKATRNNTTGVYKGYALSGVTLTSPTVLSVNYYDDYDFLGQNGIPGNTDENAKYTAESGYGTWYGVNYTAANKYKNKLKLTGTLTAQLLPDGTASATYLYSVMYYDIKGQLIQAKSSNHLTSGTEKEYLAYNFTGQPVKRKHIHAATGKTMQTEVYTYEYDHAGRLASVKHKLNSNNEVTLAANTYDELGRLKASQRNGQTVLTTNYTYNIRSWVKSISTGSLFSQTLYYNDSYGGNKPRYNGNISAMTWTVPANNVIKGYRFAYDPLSRLTSADYLENGAANSRHNTSYTYDKHGNITALTRSGHTGTSTYGIVDNLAMTYNGNQLIKVTDTGVTPSISTSADFRSGSVAAVQYLYDANGNLKQDLNKGIGDIAYNSLNLPSSFTISNSLGSATNTYVYSADGRKLKVTKGTFTTDYCGNVIYENNVLKRILVDGGYYENGTYYFYLTDHLGNNRVVANQSGNVVQSTQYYPFGMAFADGTNPSTQPYKFGGKELDSDRGLNWYDFHARWQDPALAGRFLSVDPLAEKYYSVSPYVYCMNNPVRFVDPTGMEVKLSGMSEEEQEEYNKKIAIQRDNSKLFDALYSFLESSKNVFMVRFGQIKSETTGELSLGQFTPNKSGGGTITLLNNENGINPSAISEEFFHAFQHDNKDKYAGGEFNFEFEAKVFTTAVGSEFIGGRNYPGMSDFQDKIKRGDYGNGLQVISPEVVASPLFIISYAKAAKGYAKHNREANYGNGHYKKDTTVTPYSLQKVVIDAYKKR